MASPVIPWSKVQSNPQFSSLTPDKKLEALNRWKEETVGQLETEEDKDILLAGADLESRKIMGEEVPPLQQYLPEYRARKAADQQGILTQFGGALKTGLSDVTTGLGVTFDAATGDNAELAQGLEAMNATDAIRQQNKTTRDIELEKAFAENAKQFKEAKGFWPSAKELIDYVGIAATNPVAMTKMALESAPNALISIGATTAGGIGGTLLAGPAGGVAAASAAGSAANIPMEIPGAIRQKLLEATGGQAANWNASQIKDYLDANPQVKEEGLQKGLVRGAAIGVVEGLTAGLAGKVATIPERAGQKAVLAEVARQIGKDVASPVDVADFIRSGGKAAEEQLANVAADTISQYSRAQKAGLLTGAAALETGGEGLGELSAQVASGEEISPTDIFVEMAAGGILSGLSTAGARLASAASLVQQASSNENALASTAAAKAAVNEASKDLKNQAAEKLVDVSRGIESLVPNVASLLQPGIGVRAPAPVDRAAEIQSRLAEIEKRYGPRQAVTLAADGTPSIKNVRINTTEEDALLNELNALSPAPAPAPSQTQTAETATTGSVPLMVTRGMRQQLSDLGYTKAQVNSMTPAYAQNIIAGNVTASRAPAPAPAPAPTAKTDEEIAREPISSIISRTPVGQERDKAFSERRQAAVRLADSLQSGDKIIDDSGEELIIEGKVINGKGFVQGGRDVMDLAAFLTSSTARDSQGNQIELPAGTIVRKTSQETTLPSPVTAPSATPTTPITDATLQRQVPENRVEERVQTDEGGSPAETGRGDRPLVSGQVETKGQEGLADVTISPQGVVPTESLPEGQPTPRGVGKPRKEPNEPNALGFPRLGGDVLDRMSGKLVLPAKQDREGRGEYDALEALLGTLSKHERQKISFTLRPGENAYKAYTIDKATSQLEYETPDAFVKALEQALENRRNTKANAKRAEASIQGAVRQLEAFNADKGKGQELVNLDDLSEGSKVTVEGTTLEVESIQSDEDARVTFVNFKPNSKYGKVSVAPEDNLRAQSVENPEVAPVVDEFTLAAEEEKAPEPAAKPAPQAELDLGATEGTRPKTRGETAKPQVENPIAELQKAKAEGEAEQAQGKLPMTPREQQQKATQEKLTALDKEEADLLAQFRKSLGKTNVGFNPETFGIAVQLAGVAVRKGAVRFADFAQYMKESLPELWDSIKDELAAVWYRVSQDNENLEMPPGRAEIKSILENLSQAPVQEEESNVLEAEDAPSTVAPEPLDARIKIGFGKRKNKTVQQLLDEGETNYLFRDLFNEQQTSQAQKDQLEKIREVVRSLPEYQNYVRNEAKTTAQLKAERESQSAAFDTTLNNIKGAGANSVTVGEDGSIQVKLPSASTLKDKLTKNGFYFDAKKQAYVTKDYAAAILVAEKLASQDERAFDRDSSPFRIRKEIREQLENADDESERAIKFNLKRIPTPSPLARQTMEFFQNSLKNAKVTLQTAVNQLTDALLISSAKQNGKPMFLLGAQAGYGKTFVLGASLAEMLERESINDGSKIIYFTNNEALIEQAKRDMKGLFDPSRIVFRTYSYLDNMTEKDFSNSDVLIFDEAHNVRYGQQGTASPRAKKAEEMIKRSAFTIFSSATPYESIAQMRFLWPTGVFKELAGKFITPSEDTELGWFDFASAAGGDVKTYAGKPNSVEFKAEGDDLLADQMFAREFLRKKGMFSFRPTDIPAGMIDANFSSVSADPKWKDMAEKVIKAFEAVGAVAGTEKAYQVNLLKRILEAAKIPASIELAKAELAANPEARVVVFSETRSEADRKLSEISDVAAMLRANPEASIPDGFPQNQKVINALAYLYDNLGVKELAFPSIQEIFKTSFGEENVTFYTGEESTGARKTNLQNWKDGKVRLMVATMAAGGTGLSLHDTSKGGKFPRSQININLPWRASDLEQVTRRTARSGMTSQAKINWLFAEDMLNEKTLAKVVAGRLASMSALVTGTASDDAAVIGNYEWNPIDSTLKVEATAPINEGTNADVNGVMASFLTADTPEGEVRGTVSKADFEAGLRAVEGLIKNARAIVIQDTRENLLKRDDIEPEAKETIRRGAQGLYLNGRAIIVRDGIKATSFTATPAHAAAAVIFHEIMHNGMDILRSDPQFAPSYQEWLGMIRDNVTEAMLDNLTANKGYREYSDWRTNPVSRVKASEEVFVRQLEGLFNRKGDLPFKQKTLLDRFRNWLRDLLSRVFNAPVEGRIPDEVLASWGRKIANAVQVSRTTSGGVMGSFNALDAEYLAAVQAGDMEKAQRMVDEAAKAAGYYVKAYHGTGSQNFTVFDKSKARAQVYGPGFYFTDRKELAKVFGNKVLSVYLSIKSPQVLENTTDGLKYVSGPEKFKDADSSIVSPTYYGDPNSPSKVYRVTDPSQIKSADPVTYDDAGNVIPLSQRFNPATPDIRMSLGDAFDGQPMQRRGKDRISTFSEEERAAVSEYFKGDRSFDKLKQFLGLAGGGEMDKTERLDPLKKAAMFELGFEEDDTGSPIVTPEATASTKAAAALLLDPASGYAAAYNKNFGSDTAAAAVLQMEMLRYALALAAKGDESLLISLRRNWNGVVLGAYVTATSAGRVLNVRSHYVSNVMDTLDRMDKERTAKANEEISNLGVDEEGAKSFVESLQEAVRKLRYDEEQKRKLAERLAGNPEAQNFDKKVDDFAWISRGIESLKAEAKKKATSFLMKLKRRDVLKALKKEKEKGAANAAASILDDINAMEFDDLPDSIEEIDAEIASLEEEIGDLLHQLEDESWITSDQAPPDDDAPADDQEDIDTVETADNENEATEAARRVIDNLKAFLKKKFTKKAPKETVYAKLKKLVDAAIAKPKDYTFNRFQAEAEKDLAEFNIDPEVQEELIAKAFTVFSRYQQKEAERLIEQLNKTPEMQKIDKLPERASEVRDLVRKFAINKDRLEGVAFIERMTKALEAIGGVDAPTVQVLVKSTYNHFVRVRQEQIAKKVDAIRTALLNGSRKTLAQRMLSDKTANALDPSWRASAMLTLLRNSGLSAREAQEALAKFTSSDMDLIFGVAAGIAKQISTERANKAILSYIKRYEKDLATPRGQEKPRKESLNSLVRAQVKVPLEESLFIAEAARFGATEAQAKRLFNLAAVESSLLLAEDGRRPTKFRKLAEFILNSPEIANDPQLRKIAIENFLRDNGYTDAMIASAQSWIEQEVTSFIKSAKQDALDRRVAELRKQAAARAAPKEKKPTVDNPFVLSGTAAEKLQKDLEMIRKGLGDLEADPAQTLAQQLGYQGFRDGDYRRLAELDAKITKAFKDGRLHDANLGVKELYELLSRRRAPAPFLKVLGISYVTSALSGLGTIAVNYLNPAGSFANRVFLDMGKALIQGKFSEMAEIGKYAIKALKKIKREMEFGLLSGASNVAMNNIIFEVTSLQAEVNAAQKLLKTGKRPNNTDASLKDKLEARYTLVASWTGIVSRTLATADHVWSSVLQDYLIKTESMRIFGSPRVFVPLVASIQNQETQFLNFNLSVIDEVASKVDTLIANNNLNKDTVRQLVEELEIDPKMPAENRVFLSDFKGDLRRLPDVYQQSDALAKNIKKLLSRSRNNANLRFSDRVNRGIFNAMSEQVSPEAAQSMIAYASKETEYEMGTHGGEDSPVYDVVNYASNMVRAVGKSVKAKNPILGTMIFGFFGIPVNLFNRAMWLSPYGLIRYGIQQGSFLAPFGGAAKQKPDSANFYQQSMQTNAQVRQRLLEAWVGTAAIGLMLLMKGMDDDDEEGFNVTLAGPSNKTEQDAWRKMGHRQGAMEYVTKGGKVISLNWARGVLEPWKIALMSVGALDDMRLNRKLGDQNLPSSFSDYFSALAYGWSKQAAFFGVKNTAGAFLSVDPEINIAGNLLYKLNPLFPFAGAIKSMENMVIGPDRFRGRTGAFWLNVPLARSLATERAVNALGDPQGLVPTSAWSSANDRAWYQGIPLMVSGQPTGNDKLVYDFILKRGTGPGIPQRAALENANGLMDDSKWLEYVATRGRIVKGMMVRNLSRLNRMDDEDLSKALGEISSDATRMAKRQLRYK